MSGLGGAVNWRYWSAGYRRPAPKPRKLTEGEQIRRASTNAERSRHLIQAGWRRRNGRWFAPGTSTRTSQGVSLAAALRQSSVAPHRDATAPASPAVERGAPTPPRLGVGAELDPEGDKP